MYIMYELIKLVHMYFQWIFTTKILSHVFQKKLYITVEFMLDSFVNQKRDSSTAPSCVGVAKVHSIKIFNFFI